MKWTREGGLFVSDTGMGYELQVVRAPAAWGRKYVCFVYESKGKYSAFHVATIHRRLCRNAKAAGEQLARILADQDMDDER